MINFKVIKIGDIVKGLVKISVLVMGIILFTSLFNSAKKINFSQFVEERKKDLKGKNFMDILEENLNHDSPKEDIEKQNLLSSEIDTVAMAFTKDENVNLEITQEENSIDVTNDINENTGENNAEETVPISAQTKVVTEHNLNNVFNTSYGTVQIRNQTSITLTQEMLIPDVAFDKSNIIIFHTHTSECYTPSDNYQYVPSGNFRTLDTNCSVVGVGNELTSRLTSKGINVIHDSTFHDYPQYNGAYTRSLQTVQGILNTTPADLVIDLHRDAIGDSSYGPSVMIGDEKVAQIMFVMGSNEGGLSHPNWLQNLKIAIKIQAKANEMYPGLFRPILLSKYRYNEHLAKGSCILEVGATGNTMEECIGSMKYLAEVINAVE